jgi:hypothetical protein
MVYIPGKTEHEAEIKKISAHDWKSFLLARSAEMKKGIYDIYFYHIYSLISMW